MATKRVRRYEREEERARIPSPAKCMRLEEEEEMNDASGSLDMDTSQMCSQVERTDLNVDNSTRTIT